ncbi:MAG: AAA family ATPase [bacterium]|nr:AAA family ATPase [bacterium]
MKLVSFQVRTFRNIVDSGEIEVDDDVTCLVGKNEAGKSALLEALYLLNPSYDEAFDVDEQYPKWLLVQDRRQGDPNQRVPITATFELGSSESEALEHVVGPGVLTDNKVRMERHIAVSPAGTSERTKQRPSGPWSSVSQIS